MNLTGINDVTSYVLSDWNSELKRNIFRDLISEALKHSNYKILLLGSKVFVNALAELSEFHLSSLSYAAKLGLVVDGPLSVVLDTVLGDFKVIDLNAHNAAHGEEPELLDIDALLLGRSDGQVIARPDLFIIRVVFSLLLSL